MLRLTVPALAVAALGALILAPASLAGQPATQPLNPPAPSFYDCKATGSGTICQVNRVFPEDPVDTGIQCGSGAGAFDIWDQGIVHQRAQRFYDADGNLTRRVNHEQWSSTMWSNPLNGKTVPYTQADTITDVLAVPGDFSSATETTVGQNIYTDPATGRHVMRVAGRTVIGPDGTVESRSGSQPFLDAFVDGDFSVFDGICAALTS